MEKVNLLNVNNEVMVVNVIRYFLMDNNNYLIYSLDEVDEQGYVKLYAAKIEGKDASFVGINIDDEGAWNSVKELIKVIVKANQTGVAEVDDLNYKELENAQLVGSRVFKLSNQLVELLGANKKEIREEPIMDFGSIDINPISNAIQEETIVETSNEEVDYYKNLYNQEKAKNDALIEKLNEIKRLIN